MTIVAMIVSVRRHYSIIQKNNIAMALLVCVSAKVGWLWPFNSAEDWCPTFG